MEGIEGYARELWTHMQACLPTHYRTLDWYGIPQTARMAIVQLVADRIRERDYKVIQHVRKQFVEEHSDWLETELSIMQLGFRIKTKRLEPPDL